MNINNLAQIEGGPRGIRVRRLEPWEMEHVTALSVGLNGAQAAVSAGVRDRWRHKDPNGNWGIEEDGQLAAIFEGHILSTHPDKIIKKCGHEEDMKLHHFLSPSQVSRVDAPVWIWIEFIASLNWRATGALLRALPCIFRVLRPNSHPDDMLAGLPHRHFDFLPTVQNVLDLKPTEIPFPACSVSTLPLFAPMKFAQ